MYDMYGTSLFLKPAPPRTKTVLVISVNDTLIRGWIHEYTVTQDNHAHVRPLYTCEMALRYIEKNIDEQSIARTLPLFFSQLHKWFPVITDVVYVLHEPWIHTEIELVSHSHPQSFLVSQKLVNRLLQDALITNKKKVEKKFKNFSLICKEHKVLNTYINGYVIDQPVRKQAHTLALSCVSSYISELLSEVVQTITYRYLPQISEVAIHSAAYYFGNALSILNIDNSLIVDIGRHVTSLHVIQKDGLKQTISFPKGYDIFENHLPYLGKKGYASRKILEMFFQGSLDSESHANILERMKKIIKYFQEEFQDPFTDLYEEGYTPRAIFVMSEPHVMPLLRMSIQQSCDLLFHSDTCPLVLSSHQEIPFARLVSWERQPCDILEGLIGINSLSIVFHKK